MSRSIFVFPCWYDAKSKWKQSAMIEEKRANCSYKDSGLRGKCAETELVYRLQRDACWCDWDQQVAGFCNLRERMPRISRNVFCVCYSPGLAVIWYRPIYRCSFILLQIWGVSKHDNTYTNIDSTFKVYFARVCFSSSPWQRSGLWNAYSLSVCLSVCVLRENNTKIRPQTDGFWCYFLGL